MKEQKETIEQLLELYFEAQATDDDERRLREYFLHTENVDPSLQYAQAMFCGFDALAAESMPPRHKPVMRWRRTVVWSLAAAAVVTLGVFLGVEALRTPYCYIDGVAIYDKEVAMQTMSYLHGFSELQDPMQIADQLIKMN